MTREALVVVGASTLGCRFALEARKAGLDVVLVDEHPQSVEQMALDAPYFYGARLPASVDDKLAMMDNVLGANDLLMECLEADVDVRLGTVAWGVFQNRPNALHNGAPRIALASETGEFLEFGTLVLATGSRDFVPSFTGWDLPGVLGVNAAERLVTSYQAYQGLRTLVLGTGNQAVAFAAAAVARGVEVAGLVEPSAALRCDAEHAQIVARLGLRVFLDRVIDRAEGVSAVTGAGLVAASSGQPAETVDCDTICVAIGSLPNIEIAAAMGCELFYSPEIGSWLPRVTGTMRTSVPNLVWLSRYSAGPEQVEAALRGLGDEGGDDGLRDAVAGHFQGPDIQNWVDRLDAHGDSGTIVCQCEGVTRGELIGLNPPRYLRGTAPSAAKTPLVSAPAGPAINLDQVKRMTRVGMGHCQGRRCRDEAGLILRRRFGVEPRNMRPSSYRFPVRAVKLDAISREDEGGLRWAYWVGSSE